jgi:RNA recognition motif-containing protein
VNIYVGNLPFSATQDELRSLFATHGQVDSVSIVMDKDNDRSRGFGFVEMPDEAGAQAVAALDGQDMDGRPLRVTEARKKEVRTGGFGTGGFGSGGFGGGGFGGGGGGRGGGGGGRRY